MPGLEPLFLQYGIDMGFWGHEHSYERFYPIADRKFWNSSDAYTNPKAPVYIISGSAVRFFSYDCFWAVTQLTHYSPTRHGLSVLPDSMTTAIQSSPLPTPLIYTWSRSQSRKTTPPSMKFGL
ncbi:hypothetical protein TELCIR_00390 [Teladorsagia circumcincta]|uniref:Iron/zinc purple acid phosphatase-like C-terminal domain-containing protein n=1 Tax=Teladorsagia circumcincta TaxID=45464 RepID=A0A2G9V4Y9_TELCI|nr:hypothetical protein TELCIR_00390 [Teladorsagia circumcincta]